MSEDSSPTIGNQAEMYPPGAYLAAKQRFHEAARSVVGGGEVGDDDPVSVSVEPPRTLRIRPLNTSDEAAWSPSDEPKQIIARAKNGAWSLLAAPQPQHLSRAELQVRRDEVRAMVWNGKPSPGIPQYKGRRGGDGPATYFLERHYGQYIPRNGVHTLFMHDLRSIDPRLARAAAHEALDGAVLLGTKSDLIDALVAGRFHDGPDSAARIYDTLRMRKKL